MTLLLERVFEKINITVIKFAFTENLVLKFCLYTEQIKCY